MERPIATMYRNRRVMLKLLAMGIVGVSMLFIQKQIDSRSSPVAFTASPAGTGAVLGEYCFTCHGEDRQRGDLNLAALATTGVPSNAEPWEKVIRKLRSRTMPPVGRPRPDVATYDALATWLESEIDLAAATQPNPGRTEAVHRLNRAEYQNAVRDLLALDIDASKLLPADDQSYGFDNIAGVLKISPTLLERYMGAAREVSRLAIGDPRIAPRADTFRLRMDFGQYGNVDGLPLGTRGGTAIQYHFPVDGEYNIKVVALGLQEAPGAVFKEDHELEITINGERVKLVEIKKADDARDLLSADFVPPDRIWEVRTPVNAGPHTVGATFVMISDAIGELIRQPFTRPHSEGDFVLYAPHIGTVTISGPFNAQRPADTPSRRRIFSCLPASVAEEGACASQIVAALARRAYRRPVTDEDLRPLLGFYAQARTSGDFETGIERALRALLVSPDFLVRVESDSPSAQAGSPYHLSDLELASRMSFLLWSSIPDDELLDLAIQGRLKEAAVIEDQVRRMLADPRSEALAKNFAGQWFRLRNVAEAPVDNIVFPNFSDNVRQALVRETELFFHSILREGRTVSDLLTADYTFLNEPLAKHYGIKDVYGSHFRRVLLKDGNRRGLLGQGSILTVTSYPNRTSPVGRGKWILENVLGAPPPPPPPDIPDLAENGEGGTFLTMREQMQQHRSNPVCASCHNLMDPLGFGLESFDAVGRWRSVSEGALPIDSAGTLPDGSKFNGPAELSDSLAKNPERFASVVVEKLMTYALGRGIEHTDQPAVRRVVEESAPTNYSIATLIVGVIKSAPFQMRTASMGSESVSTAAAAPITKEQIE
jgi:hypothetical protein